MPDSKLYISMSIFISIGFVFVSSLSLYVTDYYNISFMYFVVREIAFCAISLLILWALVTLDADKYLHIIGISIFLLSLLTIIAMPFLPPSLVRSIGGAKRWITLPFFSISPIEFFKIGFVYFLSWSFSRKFGDEKMPFIKELKLVLPYFILFFIIVLLVVLLQNDIGQIITMGITLALLLLFAGGSMSFFFLLLTVSSVIVAFFIVMAQHRIDRLEQWWVGVQDFVLSIFPNGIASHLRVDKHLDTYQLLNSYSAIKNGGLTGTGVGNGDIKLGYLSDVHTDFILAGISEEIGFIGLFCVVLLFIFILQRVLKIANRAEVKREKLFCIGIAILLFSSFIINAFGTSGLLPIKGIAVPFLSYGGSSMIASSIAMGLVLMISKKVNFKN